MEEERQLGLSWGLSLRPSRSFCLPNNLISPKCTAQNDLTFFLF